MKQSIYRINLLVFSLLLVLSSRSFSSELTAREVIDHCECHYRTITTLQFSSDVVSQTSQGNTPDPSYGDKNLSVVKIDMVNKLACFRVDINNTFKGTDKGFQKIPVNSRLEYLFQANRGLTFQTDTVLNEIVAFHSTEKGIHGNVEKEGWKSIFFETYILTPIGFFKIGDKSIDLFEFIKNMQPPTLEAKEAEGVHYYEIAMRSDQFNVVVSVFPDKDFMLKSFVIEKIVLSDDYPNFRKLEYKGIKFSDKGKNVLPDEFSVNIESGELIDVRSLYEGKLVSETLPRYRSKMAAKIVQADVNATLTTSDFHFETNIPNGTQVYVDEVPQIEYIWLDGKIEPKTNELMLKIAQGGHKFRTRSRIFYHRGRSLLGEEVCNALLQEQHDAASLLLTSL